MSEGGSLLGMRTAGKRGVIPRPPIPELQLSRFRSAAPAPPPAFGDVSHGITDWGMDHNDRLSCCGYAMADHYMIAKTGNTALGDRLGGVGLDLYFEYGVSMGWAGPPDHPDQPDQGVDNPSWFNFLMTKGIIDAWAELPLGDVDETHAAMLNFSGVCVAVELTDDAEQLFSEHQPWTMAQGEAANQNEGHDILLVSYTPTGDEFVTWGALQRATIPWDAACITNVYVFVSREDAQRNGVDIESLTAACMALGGHKAA